MFVEMDWQTTTESKFAVDGAGIEEDKFFNITSYGRGAVQFVSDEANEHDQIAVLEQIFTSKAVQGGHDDITIQDMSSKHAPQIKRYSCGKAPEGFNFVVVVNDEPEAKFVERVKYETLEGLELLGNDVQGQGYELTVKPGTSKCIVIRASFEGTKFSASTSQAVYHGTTMLKQMCLEANQKEPIDGDDISRYQYQHPAGFFYLYVNRSSNKRLEETLKFQLEGLEIEGQEDNENVALVVGPGEDGFVQLNATGSSMRLGMAMSRRIVPL